MNHREIAKPEFVKWIEKLDLLGKTFLEIGPANTTDFRVEVEKRGAIWFGLDLNTKYQNNIIEGTMESMPFSSGFDYMFACHSFEHTTNPLLTLAQIKCKCRKEFMLITPYHCKEQVLDGDKSHFFVLTDIQMRRLLIATQLKEINIYTQTKAKKRQDWNLITIGGV